MATPSSPPLLREWSYQAPPTVPVAPAVVVSEEDALEVSNEVSQSHNNHESNEATTLGDSTNSSTAIYSYPVATFVHNLVQSTRSSMEHIYAGIAETVLEEPSSDNTPQTTSETSISEAHPLSVRSTTTEGDSLRTVPLTVGEPSTRSVQEQNWFTDQEFVLIDGDLVALPPPPNEAEQEGLEDYVQSQHHKKKAFRGIRKWIKKKKRAKNNEHPQQQQQQNTHKRNKPKHRRSWKQPPSTPSPRGGAAVTFEEAPPSSSSLPTAAAPLTLEPQIPTMTPISECTSSSSAVSADFIGNVGNADVASLTPAQVAFIEPPEQDEKDLKVDSLLSQARSETDVEQDLAYFGRTQEEEEGSTSLLVYGTLLDSKASSSASASIAQAHALCALSAAASTFSISEDQEVFNDTLKLIMLGQAKEKSTLARAIKNGATPHTQKSSRKRSLNLSNRSTLGVQVYHWDATPNVKVCIWDVQGATTLDASQSNAGAHPSTQSLFYTSQSLYVLVWDLAATSPLTYPQRRDRGVTAESVEEDDDEEEEDDEYYVEQERRRATRALEAEIYQNVLQWMEGIPPDAAVLPVVTLPHLAHMDDKEVARRCDMMQMLLTKYLQKQQSPRIVYGTRDNRVLKVDASSSVAELQKIILNLATGPDRILTQVGETVPPQTVHVLQTIRRLKQDHKVVLMDHLLAEMKVKCSVADVTAALHFLSSVGELLYFGSEGEPILSNYIILSRRWLVSALSCILRNDMKRELQETRRFMNLQCAFSGHAFTENDVAQTLLSNHSSTCPILSSTDSAMLWQSMSFMREAADRTLQLSETSSTMFDFLERLLVKKGVFLPLQVSRSIEDQLEPTAAVYFVPSLLSQAEPSDVWTYKSSDSWMTCLCHSWLLRDGASSSDLMEHVTVSLLQDLYEFSHCSQGMSANHPLGLSSPQPMGLSSVVDFNDSSHDHTERIGQIKIHQLMAWKSSFLVKIGCVFSDSDSGEIRESFTEIFVSLVDAQSNHCVATNSMGTGAKKLIVCGKGQVGHHGRKMWKGGYGLVLDSIKASVAHLANVDRSVICPDCLAHSHPGVAATWSWDSVRAAAESGGSGLRCTRGHLVDASLVCGACNLDTSSPIPKAVGPRVAKPVSSLLPSTVLVGLWDPQSQKIRSVGSGFVADKKQGLVVTAGHILFDMRDGRNFGDPYFGLKNARAVIGVIPDDGHTAVFRYFAEIAAHDIQNIDACVLRITSKLENDVEGEGEACGSQKELLLGGEALKNENLQQLRMTRRFELEETVRILGFNQGGEGLLEIGKHINRCADFAKGYICKKFKAYVDDSASESSCSTSYSARSFCPREEIVVMAPTISGHSGGPCVNDDGKVVGILSRADPADRQRCYLVPTSELKALVSIAREKASGPSTPIMSN